MTKPAEPILTRIITPVLALLIIGATVALWGIALFHKFDQETKDVGLFILGSISTMSAGVVGYYFGSSSGSKAKSDTISDMVEKKKDE